MAKILYLVPYQFIKPKSGGQFAAYQEICCLAENNTVKVLGVDSNEPSADFESEHFCKNSKSRYFNLFLIFKLARIVQSFQADWIILEHPYWGWLLYFVKKFTGVRTAIRSQNVEGLRFRDMGKPWWKILLAYEQWVHNHVDAVLCITEEDRAYFTANGVKTSLLDFPFGTDKNSSPSPEVRNQSRAKLRALHQIELDQCILLYNGNLGYLPNKIGLDILLEKAVPELIKRDFKFKLIICGGNLPASYQSLKEYESQGVIYTGFVDDIELYFKGCHLFLNPVLGGGGIKTKLIDALSNGTVSISSKDGAQGLVQSTAGNKLILVEDGDGIALADAIIENSQRTDLDESTPSSYYEYYNWKAIGKVVMAGMKS
jgi:glycosyltransferase involved in cell wall biosynthesis